MEGKTDNDYPNYLVEREARLNDLMNSPERFVSLSQRKNDCKLVPSLIESIESGKYLTDWRGLGMCKDPFDIVIYQSMLWDIKPATVIEVGALQGGTALWFGDLIQMFGLNCHVYSFDIDLSMVHEVARNREGITFLQGDCNEIEKTFTDEMLQKLPHPWMIIEDAHINVLNVLEQFYRHSLPGDYFLVEDTASEITNDMTGTLTGRQNRACDKWGSEKKDTLHAFLQNHPKELRIDTFYTDRFGYNMTWNQNGFIKRV